MSSLLDGNSRFAYNPTRINNIERARFNLSFDHKTSFNVGQLIPFDVIEVLPGDTFDLETNMLVRLQTLLAPVMDDLYLDVYWFFVPNRLVWEHWKNFMGENTASAWYPSTQYEIPQIQFEGSPGSNANGSVFDYMGIPPKILGSGGSVNALPWRAYQLIWNEWFRDENLQDPLLINLSDTAESVTDENLSNYMPLMANKYHDYFTSCLPAPQKGPDVGFDILGSNIPVASLDSYHTNSTTAVLSRRPETIPDSGTYAMVTHNGREYVSAQMSDISATGYKNTSGFKPSNLWAIPQDTSITVNALRLAFATQRLYERDARGGTRYIEILKSHFGVTSPDSRLQRPELLSYNHIPVNVMQIVQNSETNETPQGHVTALSVTANSDGSFTKSFVEHGYIIGLCCARYNHTYQQGLNRMWSRKSRFDFYWPVFAHLGEQPVLEKEIYTNGTSAPSDAVFGYQEAWADYRYKPNRTSAEMRSTHLTPLDMWHFGDNYNDMPRLSDDWIKETPVNVNRTLAVTSEVANQIFCDIYVKNIATRPMPMYSIPGLLDHL